MQTSFQVTFYAKMTIPGSQTVASKLLSDQSIMWNHNNR